MGIINQTKLELKILLEKFGLQIKIDAKKKVVKKKVKKIDKELKVVKKKQVKAKKPKKRKSVKNTKEAEKFLKDFADKK